MPTVGDRLGQRFGLAAQAEFNLTSYLGENERAAVTHSGGDSRWIGPAPSPDSVRHRSHTSIRSMNH